MVFWDTSALVKLYVRERDSEHFVELARKSETRAAISQISIHEMRCLLHRKEFAERFHRTPVSSLIVNSTMMSTLGFSR